jgi:hypothetical protein
VKHTAAATIDRTAADLETAFDYGRRIEELRRFVEKEMKPAIERLEAAGYPAADLLAGVLDHNPRDEPEFDLILDQLDMVRAANGQPGVADWLFWRVSAWNSLDEARAELEHGDDYSVADAVVAFEHKFMDTYPKLQRLISLVTRHKAPAGTPWDITELDGRPLDDIEAEVRKAVAKMTGAVTAVAG